MSLTMPDWFKAATMEISLDRATVTHTSQTTKMTQMVDLYSWQWRISVQFPPCGIADSGAREALVNRLAGGAETIRLYHRYRPAPIGTMRGTPTLNANAAQFANQIQIAGAWDTSRQNLLKYTEQFDNSAWGKTRGTISANATAAPDGSMVADAFIEDSTAGLSHDIAFSTSFSAGTYTFSISAKPNGRSWVCIGFFNLSFAFFNASTGAIGTVGSGISASVAAQPGGWFRFSVTYTATSTFYAYIALASANGVASYNGDGSSGMYLYGAQLEPGSAATEYIPKTAAPGYAPGTLQSGDMLGIGSQLLQVADDATANASGVMTVNLVNRLRTSATSGASIVWDKPTAEFYLADGKARSVYSPNMGGGQALEFVERVS